MNKIDSPSQRLYGEITRKKTLSLALLAVALGGAFLADIMTGPAWLSLKQVASALFASRSVDISTRVIVLQLRLPVALMAVCVGAALGSAGAEMQTILNNPLASPYTLGVSSAAGFGAALALVGGVGLIPAGAQFLIAANAFIFALGSSLAVYGIAGVKKGSTEIIILAGIALLFLFYSLTAMLEYLATEEQLQAVVFWLFGSLNKATWVKLLIVSAVFAVVFPLILSRAWKLTALRLGETEAESLGINVKRLRLTTLVLISLLTATAVCFVGTIGFIGIVAPHIARSLGGEDQRFFLPLSALVGAALLSTASVASKLIMPGAVFPIGIVTSFIGIPFFLFLILSKRRSYW